MGFKERLYSLFGVTIKENEPMKYHTGYALGGNADYFVTCYSVKSLRDLIELCLDYKIDYKIIGNGTNLIFSDKGFHGVVISLKGLNTISHKDGKVFAMCGVTLCDLVFFSAEYGLYGGESLIGIPATVGGAIVMNAGAFNKSIGDFIQGVQTIKDGRLCYYDKEDCMFSYRKSAFFGKNEPIISATFLFEKGGLKDQEHKLALNRCKDKRRNDQPSGRSCGCVFKNPVGDYAGRLIDSANLKGFSLGKAKVSTKHANFIMAEKGTTAQEIFLLVNTIKEKIFNEFGIHLEEEIEFVGEF